VAVGSHDTASAVAAVPAIHEARYAYLSSGTWSLLGVEVDEPDFGLLAQRLNLTNEAGVFGNIRLLKNINGLWLVQECRRAWKEEGKDWSYQKLSELVSKVTSPIALIDPDEQRFALRGAMPQMICDYCSETGQIEPNGPGEILRVIEDSLALKVRHVLSLLEQTTGNRVEVLHVIGGGAQNEGLNQRICDCINRPVIVGPVEATAAGNVVMQLYADSKIKSLSEGRQLVAESFDTQRYDPSEKSEWDKAYEFFTKLLKE
jgi:rhamnulokinase